MTELTNPHLTYEVSMSDAEVKRLNRQYAKRQRYSEKYGASSMRSLRSYFKRVKRENPELSFREWLRSLDKWDGTFSPKAARIRAAA